jgi:membrane-bound lytic murein transglycosylase A
MTITDPEAEARPRIQYRRAAFSDLAGWEADDHLAALGAFRRSCGPVLAKSAAEGDKWPVPAGLLETCRLAQGLSGDALTPATARSFFEQRFVPHRVAHEGPDGLLTGYYEPILDGARAPGGPYRVPVYRRPPDLINLVDESQRGAVGQRYTHMRKTPTGTEVFETRAEIEAGALAGQGLELLWLTDPVETFMMHIQGSGRIRLPDGSMIRITYDGKNGHPYTSVGRYLIDTGLFPAGDMSLEAMKDWLKADAERGRKAMQQNASFIFFRELSGAEAESALGVMDIPLTEGRSLAVDAGYHCLGLPVWVAAPEITHASGPGGFHRLMIAQDVGSAIKGPERGDLYFGSGDEAGRLAGVTKHPGRFFVLLPNAAAAALA